MLGAAQVAVANEPSPSLSENPSSPGELPLDEVGVTADRRHLLTDSSVRLDVQDLSAQPRRTAEDALRLVPGFTLVQHGSEGKGHQFFLRGFDAIHGADLELTVDGIPVNEWSNVHAQGYIDLGFVLNEVVESVEVTKGPFKSNQGPFAMAGSARYRLGVAPSRQGVRGSFTLGTTNRQRSVLTYSPRGGDGRDFLAVEAMRDDGFGQNRGITRWSGLGRQRLFDSPDLGTLSVLVSGYSARFDLPGSLRDDDLAAGLVDFYDSYDAAGRGESTRALGAAQYQWAEGAQSVEASVYLGYRQLSLLENFTGFLGDPELGDRRLQTQDGLSFGANVSHIRVLAPHLQLELGAGVRADQFEQSQDQLDQDELPVNTERSLTGGQQLTHARASVEATLAEGLWLTASGRVDVAHLAAEDEVAAGRSEAGTLTALSPRLSMRAQFAPGGFAYASYGRGFRPPEARAFSTFAPQRTGLSEELYEGGEPEMTFADVVEIGTRWRAGSGLTFGATGFATFIDRESVFDHVSGVSLQLGGTRRLGAEVQLEARPVPWLELHADATVVDARFVRSDNPVPFVPPLTASARAQVQLDSFDRGFRASLRTFALAPRPLPHGARGATLVTLDATAGYGFESFRIDLEVENLLNRRLREGEYHHASNFQPGQPASQLPVLHYVAGPPFNARLTLTTAL